MSIHLGALCTAFLVAAFVLPVVIKYAQRKRIFAEPGRRRIHKYLTPKIGGVAVFIGFVISVVLWMTAAGGTGMHELMAVLFVIFCVGLCDDLVHVQPWIKIIAQTVVGTICFFLLNVRLDVADNIGFGSETPLLVGIVLTNSFVVIVTNAYNLIDGVDGLAAVVALVVALFFGVWFYLVGDHVYALLCFALIGSTLAFLLYNWQPSRIFLGDAGSLFIGMCFALMAIRFTNANDHLPSESGLKFSASLATVACVLVVPLVDTMRIIVIRISSGISPLKADKRHIHHSLIRLGFSHRQTSLVLLSVNGLFIALALGFRNLPELQMGFIAFLTAALLVFFLQIRLFKKLKQS